MPKNIYPGTGQPAITGNASHGKPVPSNEFSMDFEVEVTEDGCYVVKFELWRKTNAISPDYIILVNRDGWLQPYCLGAGVRHKPRASRSDGPAASGGRNQHPGAVERGLAQRLPIEGNLRYKNGASI